MFSGSAHTALAHRICDELGVTLLGETLDRARSVIVSSRQAADTVRRLRPDGPPVLVLPLGHGATVEPARTPARGDIVAVGWLAANKSPELAIDVLSRLAPDVTLDPGGGQPPIVGRPEVVAAAARARAATPRLRVQFFDDRITLRHAAAATITLTAQVVTIDPSGTELAEAYQVEAALEKQDGMWVVTTARRVRNGAGG